MPVRAKFPLRNLRTTILQIRSPELAENVAANDIMNSYRTFKLFKISLRNVNKWAGTLHN